jgi:hypothetical protein
MQRVLENWPIAVIVALTGRLQDHLHHDGLAMRQTLDQAVRTDGGIVYKAPPRYRVIDWRS